MVWRRAGIVAAVMVAVCAGASQLSAQDVQDRTAVGQPSLADTVLAQDVWTMIQIWEMAGETPAGCTEAPQLGARVIAESPKDRDARTQPWVEHWTVRRCETEVGYRVAFKPARQGTEYEIAALTP